MSNFVISSLAAKFNLIIFVIYLYKDLILYLGGHEPDEHNFRR